MTDRLFIALQRVLPKHFLTALIFRVARVRVPWFKNLLIRLFVRGFKVDVSDAAHPVPSGYETFNAFFTRALADGARTIDGGGGTLISPVDGAVSAIGSISEGTLVQAKGLSYTVTDLLGGQQQMAEDFRDGSFATIYLAPYNYHRIHAPIAGRLRSLLYAPGDLYSVNDTTARWVPGLFARNERLICSFDGEHGRYALVFVGALNVGSITTPWTGEIRPKKRGAVSELGLDASVHPFEMEKGDLLGWFNMGSTVIMLLPARRFEWAPAVNQGSVLRMGEVIARATP